MGGVVNADKMSGGVVHREQLCWNGEKQLGSVDGEISRGDEG